MKERSLPGNGVGGCHGTTSKKALSNRTAWLTDTPMKTRALLDPRGNTTVGAILEMQHGGSG